MAIDQNTLLQMLMGQGGGGSPTTPTSGLQIPSMSGLPLGPQGMGFGGGGSLSGSGQGGGGGAGGPGLDIFSLLAQLAGGEAGGAAIPTSFLGGIGGAGPSGGFGAGGQIAPQQAGSAAAEGQAGLGGGQSAASVLALLKAATSLGRLFGGFSHGGIQGGNDFPNVGGAFAEPSGTALEQLSAANPGMFSLTGTPTASPVLNPANYQGAFGGPTDTPASGGLPSPSLPDGGAIPGGGGNLAGGGLQGLQGLLQLAGAFGGQGSPAGRALGGVGGLAGLGQGAFTAFPRQMADLLGSAAGPAQTALSVAGPALGLGGAALNFAQGNPGQGTLGLAQTGLGAITNPTVSGALGLGGVAGTALPGATGTGLAAGAAATEGGLAAGGAGAAGAAGAGASTLGAAIPGIGGILAVAQLVDMLGGKGIFHQFPTAWDLFPGRAVETQQKIGTGLNQLHTELGQAQTQSDVDRALENFNWYTRQFAGVGGYAGGALPGVGPQTHGKTTPQIDQNAILQQLLGGAQQLRGGLPAGGYTLPSQEEAYILSQGRNGQTIPLGALSLPPEQLLREGFAYDPAQGGYVFQGAA